MNNELSVLIKQGDRVKDANVSRIYGQSSALAGTVLRVYGSPVGMVEVRWDAEEYEDHGGMVEDCWADELEVAR